MSNKIKLLVLSDIHFEKYKGTQHKEFVLNYINKKIIEVSQSGFTPVVVLAGDIDNQDAGYSWMSKIKAKVIFIAGNHEFWNGDYYETIENLKRKCPNNVTFLHNDIEIVGQYIVIGSTLWTDIGKSINPDIFVYASSRMNDMTSITAKKWYENPVNVENLYLKFNSSADEMYEKKYWNGLIEQEENNLAWIFLEQVSDVLETLSFANKISSQRFLNHDLIDSTAALTEFTNPGLTFQDFILNLSQIDKEFAISKDEFIRLSRHNNAQKERIFQKLRHIEKIEEKEIAMLTHHLPFYEEVFIGQHRLKGETSTSTINAIQHQNFFVREGTEYPEKNHIDKASNGELSRKNDITHIVNYFNNGNKYLPQFLQNNVNLWIHGHEHLFNYSDFLKGFQILSNTVGIIFSRLNFEDGLDNIKLNKMYMQYNNFNEKTMPKKIDDLQSSLIRIPIKTPSHQEILAMAHIWGMQKFDWENYSKNLDRMMKSCAQIVNSAVEFSSVEVSNLSIEQKEQSIKELVEKTNQYVDIFNQNLFKHNSLLRDYSLSVRVRVDREFSIHKYFNSLHLNYELYFEHLLGPVPALLPLADFMGMFTGGLAFKNMEYILLIHNQRENLYEFTKSFEVLEPTDISIDYVKEFFALSSISNDLKQRQVIEERIDKKWMNFLNNLSISPISQKTSQDIEFD